jgi:TFIIF-interacting CTD phosphatase-like protein
MSNKVFVAFKVSIDCPEESYIIDICQTKKAAIEACLEEMEDDEVEEVEQYEDDLKEYNQARPFDHYIIEKFYLK